MKTKTILASLVLAVSVAAVALTAWVNRPTDSFFEANLEALADTESTISSWCVHHLEWHCQQLNSTNPELDQTVFFAVWNTYL